jgi:hypothetical protein
VPSHHLHAYGQTYAIDLVHDPADGRRPGLAWWPWPGGPATGWPLAACGNSGNSSEPHLHFQLQDHPSVLLAAGLPLRFASYQVGAPTRPASPTTSSRSPLPAEAPDEG